MLTQKRKFGDLGEKLASKFLKNNGYAVLEINYQKRIGEIDESPSLPKQFILLKLKQERNQARTGLGFRKKR